MKIFSLFMFLEYTQLKNKSDGKIFLSFFGSWFLQQQQKWRDNYDAFFMLSGTKKRKLILFYISLLLDNVRMDGFPCLANFLMFCTFAETFHWQCHHINMVLFSLY